MTLISLLTHFLLALTVLITTAAMVPLVPIVNRWYQLVVVQSASMEPTLPVGSLAIYRRSDQEYQPDDVIAYQWGDGTDAKVVLHRIIQKRTMAEEVRYVTKGDALSEDAVSFVSTAQIKGKVVGSIPKLGFVISWLQTPKGIAVILFIPLSLLLISQLTRLP